MNTIAVLGRRCPWPCRRSRPGAAPPRVRSPAARRGRLRPRHHRQHGRPHRGGEAAHLVDRAAHRGRAARGPTCASPSWPTATGATSTSPACYDFTRDMDEVYATPGPSRRTAEATRRSTSRRRCTTPSTGSPGRPAGALRSSSWWATRRRTSTTRTGSTIGARGRGARRGGSWSRPSSAVATRRPRRSGRRSRAWARAIRAHRRPGRHARAGDAGGRGAGAAQLGAGVDRGRRRHRRGARGRSRRKLEPPARAMAAPMAAEAAGYYATAERLAAHDLVDLSVAGRRRR